MLPFLEWLQALEHGVFGEPAAVWSLGVLLWELLTDGRMPFWCAIPTHHPCAALIQHGGE
jgi:hypothetical protein